MIIPLLAAILHVAFYAGVEVTVLFAVYISQQGMEIRYISVPFIKRMACNASTEAVRWHSLYIEGIILYKHTYICKYVGR
jgi:hypothetical protein